MLAGTLCLAGGHGVAEWWRTAVLALFNFGLFFPLLVVAVYRLPGGVAAAVGGLQPLLVAGFTWLLAGGRPRAVDVAVGVRGGGRGGARRAPARRPARPRRRHGGRRRQRVVLHRGRADEALPGAGQPDRRDRLAARHGRGAAGAADPAGRGAAAHARRSQPRRVGLPEPRRDGAGVRAVVQRHRPAAGAGSAAARPGRAGDRRGDGLGRAGSVARPRCSSPASRSRSAPSPTGPPCVPPPPSPRPSAPARSTVRESSRCDEPFPSDGRNIQREERCGVVVAWLVLGVVLLASSCATSRSSRVRGARCVRRRPRRRCCCPSAIALQVPWPSSPRRSASSPSGR